MSDAEILEAVFVINPRTGARARRLACAIQLLRAGKTTREVSVIIRQRFAVTRTESWQIADLASDLAGEVKEAK